jgi:hypothetical protein
MTLSKRAAKKEEIIQTAGACRSFPSRTHMLDVEAVGCELRTLF